MFFLLIAANLAVYLSSLQFLGSGRLALGGTYLCRWNGNDIAIGDVLSVEKNKEAEKSKKIGTRLRLRL